MSVSSSAVLLGELRAQTPLVQCITNSVVTNFTANTLLAIGAAPAMVDIVGEAGPFARVAGGLLVNLGTPIPEQRAASEEAVAVANDAGTPWVLDPVAIGSLPIRTALAEKLAAQHPFAIRGNASEILALAGAGTGGKGVESADETEAAAPIAMRLARDLRTVVAVSGPVDLVTDGERILRVSNGDLPLTKITGGGCALGALIAAFAAIRGEFSPVEAVAAAHVVYGIAAERAAAETAGPGSFAARLLDALYAISAAEVSASEQVRAETAPGGGA
ncbi:hydroxyethylthiazole kinase [Brevibacterium sp. S111]|uniref:hydroxyethylthiazole kinase n=1 Tax=Micrococcales TaxID=85006 RepID=UPI00107FFC6F|nr:hydroxyethylthiazole kinase [Brevibacterium sp. S111]TGD09703.1 hydroxyethylthiazole kinase [Brevibacterium sp. S111]